MGLLEQLYSVFGLVYTIVVGIVKHEDWSRADKAFMTGTGVFVILSIGSFFNELRLIPSGYRWRFTGKSILRGLLPPLLSLLHYPILFYCKGWVKRAFTFSNEAHDGVERTRQQKIFELVSSSDPTYNFAENDLLWYAGTRRWGYDRLVGDIWVRMTFEDLDFDGTHHRLKLQTKVDCTTFNHPSEIPQEDDSGHKCENVPVIVTLERIWGDLERGSLPAESGTPPTTPVRKRKIPKTSGSPADPGTSIQSPLLHSTCRNDSADLETPGSSAVRFEVTITRRREICRIRRREWRDCFRFQRNQGNQNQQPQTFCLLNLSSTEVRKWTLLQIHEYILCLDAWGSNHKQGIWRPTVEQNPELFRYCYRHVELTAAIEKKNRLRQTDNNGKWYTVV